MVISSKIKLGLCFVGLILWMILVSSCSSARKLDKATQTMVNNPAELARLCSTIFPVRDSVIYVAGEPSRDTLYEYVDVLIPVECPPSMGDTLIMWKVKKERETVIEKRRDTVIVHKRDTAKETSLQADISELSAQKKRLEKEVSDLKKYRRWWIYFIIGLVIGGGFWFYFRGKTTVFKSLLNKVR